MRILYYLEPFIELGNPMFRWSTYRNHLHPEMDALASIDGETEVLLVCSEAIAERIAAEGSPRNYRVVAIPTGALHTAYPGYLEASLDLYENDPSEAASRLGDVLTEHIGDFSPDVINVYESASHRLLADLFPKAVVLSNTLGMFSRAPFPETSALDPLGVGKHSWLARHGQNTFMAPLAHPVRAELDRLTTAFRNAILDLSPVRREAVRGSFNRVILVPLQVSEYFLFDGARPEARWASQVEFLQEVLKKTPPSVGVFVTHHHSPKGMIPTRTFRELQKRYPNLLFDRSIQNVRWCSQHVLPHVDAVVTVSSSLGLQAMLWDKPVVALGASHLSSLATTRRLDQLSDVIDRGPRPGTPNALAWLLTHYYPLTRSYHHNPQWHLDFLRRCLNRREKAAQTDFFEPIGDPVEILRQCREQLNTATMASELWKSSPRLLKKALPQLTRMERRIGDFDVISLDVFDTLLTRRVLSPSAVLELCEPEARTLLAEYGVSLARFGGYARLREAAKARAKQTARSTADREDVTLDEIYDVAVELLGVDPSVGAALAALERKWEQRASQPRQLGLKLLDRAQKLGKRIVLTSDMYLDQETIEGLLSGVGVSQDKYERLYLSSQTGCLKRTGNMFKLVVRDCGVHPSRIVHVGDDFQGDVIAASQCGLGALYLPSPTDRYLSSDFAASAWPEAKKQTTAAVNVMHGVISRTYFDEASAETSWFDDSAYRLGYVAGGPLVTGFVAWVQQQALRDGVDHLYFLARDGLILQQVNDLLCEVSSDAIPGSYLLASRRALSVASFETRQDVFESLTGAWVPRPIELVLESRFGLENVSAELLTRAGYSGPDDMSGLSSIEDRIKLCKLLELLERPILENAVAEREAYLTYLKVAQITDHRQPAMIDIGHEASLQQYLCKLLRSTKLRGYYYATFTGATQAVEKGLQLRAHLLNFEESALSDHPYCSNIGMFEFLFLAPTQSLKRFCPQTNGTVAPVFIDHDEYPRIDIAEQVRAGILQYARDFLQVVGTQWRAFTLSSAAAARTFTRFVQNPTPADAALLQDVFFVDLFGGHAQRRLVHPDCLKKQKEAERLKAIAASWWKAGAEVLATAARDAKP